MANPERIPTPPFDSSPPKPARKRIVEVSPLKEKTPEERPESNPSYRSWEEVVTQEAYARALAKAADPATEINTIYMRNAKSMARVAGIELSSETLKLYAILRADNEVTDPHASVGDQPLLAEVLYRQENYHALEKLVQAYSNIFT